MDSLRRGFWFVAGAATGAYAVVKVRRAVEIFTPDGVGARLAAVRAGARQFVDDVTAGTHERESELLAELRAGAAPDRLIEQGGPDRESPTDNLTLEEKVRSNGHR